MQDTKVEVKQCARCGELVFECYDGGLRVSADPVLLSIEQFRQAVMSDIRTFCIVKNAVGKPNFLVSMLLTDKFQPNNVLAQHKCGAVKHWSKSVGDDGPKEVAQRPPLGQGPEALRLWSLSRPTYAAGVISEMQGGQSPLTTRVSSTAHAEDKLDINRLSEAEKLLREHLGAHPDRGVQR